MSERDEFYVGYLPEAPPRLAARTRRVVAGLIAGGAGLALILAASQAPFAPAVFEFGAARDFAGTIAALPHPALDVPRPGVAPAGEGRSTYLLVAPGKHGAGDAVAGLAGRQVRLRGSLVFRDGRTMIDLEPGSLAPIGPAAAPAAGAVSLGLQTLAGEIVDSKCYLGVMRPGQGKPHRACAARCISGGIPAMLVARDRTGGVAHLLLVGRDGRPIGREVLDRVGEPVRVRGEVVREGGWLVLRADPAAFRPVEGRQEDDASP